MKNKKTLYILIPLVALIWGIVIWKVFAYKPSNQQGVYTRITGEKKTQGDTSRYVLVADYRDPFLRSSRTSGSTTQAVDRKKANNIKNVKTNSVTGIKKPTGLVYHGLIAGNQEKVGLLEIGERKMLIEESHMVGDYKILAVEQDTLRISYQDKEFSYGKQ